MVENPALKAFVAQMGAEVVLAQVLIRRRGTGFELRHVEDSGTKEDNLKLLPLFELRQWAQYNDAGQFRPLKSAPDLRHGWRASAASERELEAALNHLYPGALADWYAAQFAHPPVTNYREYTGRQSGMYRITAMLTDNQAADVIQATCDKTKCLKRRLWTIAGTAVDSASAKSIIPCLEPCAILMESARKALRAAQQENSEQEDRGSS